MNTSNTFVLLENLIGDSAAIYGYPAVKFNKIVTIGERVARVYNLENKYSRISFELLKSYAVLYAQTPFGKNSIEDILTSPDLQ